MITAGCTGRKWTGSRRATAIRRARSKRASSKACRPFCGARKANPRLAATCPTRIVDIGNPGIFAFKRESPLGPLLALFNFTGNWLNLPKSWLASHGISEFHETLSDVTLDPKHSELALPPYGRVWLV